VKVMPLDYERLFEPFIDEVDGVLCVPSDATAADVTRLAEPLGLRFPLWLDSSQSLRANISAGDYAPASSRFGPFCDNITGLNWELPDGRVVRVGERVVKSTAGYDLLRFLLGSGESFGRAKDYVLRLRPLCDRDGSFFLTGENGALEQAISRILHGPYLHWFDSVDWLAIQGCVPQLRVTVHCPSAEWKAFADYLSGCAAQHSLNIREEPGSKIGGDGLPDLALKTTPDGVIPLCRELASQNELRCVGLCYTGVVHAYCEEVSGAASKVREIVTRTASRLESNGGDWISRHLTRPIFGEEEDCWVRGLAAEWEAVA